MASCYWEGDARRDGTTRHTRHQVSHPAAMKKTLFLLNSSDRGDTCPSLLPSNSSINPSIHVASSSNPLLYNPFPPPCYPPQVSQAHSCTCTALHPRTRRMNATLQHALSTPARPVATPSHPPTAKTTESCPCPPPGLPAPPCRIDIEDDTAQPINQSQTE